VPAIEHTLTLPEYRGQGDPAFPVPEWIPCPQCSQEALLTPYIVGYGYDCGRCGMQAPIVVPVPAADPADLARAQIPSGSALGQR
jgi:hypothetical protein